jgi:hypothetical protein
LGHCPTQLLPASFTGIARLSFFNIINPFFFVRLGPTEAEAAEAVEVELHEVEAAEVEPGGAEAGGIKATEVEHCVSCRVSDNFD